MRDHEKRILLHKINRYSGLAYVVDVRYVDHGSDGTGLRWCHRKPHKQGTYIGPLEQEEAYKPFSPVTARHAEEYKTSAGILFSIHDSLSVG
jgi:hypothetical protein